MASKICVMNSVGYHTCTNALNLSHTPTPQSIEIFCEGSKRLARTTASPEGRSRGRTMSGEPNPNLPKAAVGGTAKSKSIICKHCKIYLTPAYILPIQAVASQSILGILIAGSCSLTQEHDCRIRPSVLTQYHSCIHTGHMKLIV